MPSPKPEPLSPPLSIWLVNPFDDIPGEGLVPLRYWSLARVLTSRGHDVTWWSATWSHRRKVIRTAPLGIRDDEGFTMRLVAVRPYERNISLARLASHRDFGRNFERLATEGVAVGQLERPDIIVASMPPLDSPEAAVRLARRLDATLVVDVQDLWPDTIERILPGPNFLRKIAAPLLLGRMRRQRQEALAAADGVSTTTHTYLDAVRGEIPTATPTHVCYLGSYPQEFPAVATTLVNAVPLHGGDAATVPLQCVYAGSLEVGQDIETLLAAARLLSARGVVATLHVAGSGKLEPLVRRAAESQRGTCLIEPHGLLGRHDYVRLLASCEAGLVLVKPESLVSLPNKACDYAAAGLALVNSLPGELQQLIDDNGAGVAYRAGDPTSLAAVIAMLAADRGRLKSMRAGARQLAAAEFDRERIYPLYADWLETIPSAGQAAAARAAAGQPPQ
jgi:glycosyltransferase involved in cell wall biosynthesis